MRKVRLVSSMGLGEFAFEEERDGVDAVVPERGEAGQSELAEHAGCDVVGGGASVTTEEQVERAAHPANAEPVAVEQQASPSQRAGADRLMRTALQGFRVADEQRELARGS